MKFFLTFFSLLILISNSAWATTWASIAPGLEYSKLPIKNASNQNTGTVHAFKVDLRRYTLELTSANELGRNSASVQQLVRQQHGLIGVNGGFFSPEREPLGLRVKSGKIMNPTKPISWWAVFYIQNNTPFITPLSGYQHSNQVSFALQAGPRLVINGSIPKLKEGYDERTALCITSNNQIILATTENAPMTTQEFAEILRRPNSKMGLNCKNALNLDGGSSAQMYAAVNKFNLSIPNFSTVTDAVVVKAKS